MGISPGYCCPRRNSCGLTLIEVLIALAIVAIAMTAVIKATSQTIRSTTYLQNKTIAMWVSSQVINEARVGVLRLPFAPDKLKQHTKMLGQDWYWQAQQEATPNKRIAKITVQVFARENDNDEASLFKMESFIYHAK